MLPDINENPEFNEQSYLMIANILNDKASLLGVEYSDLCGFLRKYSKHSTTTLVDNLSPKNSTNSEQESVYIQNLYRLLTDSAAAKQASDPIKKTEKVRRYMLMSRDNYQSISDLLLSVSKEDVEKYIEQKNRPWHCGYLDICWQRYEYDELFKNIDNPTKEENIC